jgi:hypothetical protein
MSAPPQTPAQQVAQGFWALVGLSFIGFWPIAIFALGVSFLLWFARSVLLAVFVLATAGFVLIKTTQRTAMSVRRSSV